MAGSFSDYLENALLDHVLGKTTYTAPGSVFVGLFTTAPTDAGGGIEVAGGGYARGTVVNGTANWPASVAGVKHNGSAITWGTASANWGTVVAFALFDAASSGNMLLWGDMATNKVIGTNDVATFAASDITVTLA